MPAAPSPTPSPLLVMRTFFTPSLLPIRTALCAILLAVCATAPAWAQWSDDPMQNLILADRPDGQAQPKLAPTADGGFYVSWLGGVVDGFDVYLQRLGADGQAQWAEDGVRVADRAFSSTQDYGLARSADGDALLAFRFPDGSGQAQAVANRIDGNGTPLWGDPGVFVSADASGAASPRITGMPDGGAVVAWTSFGTGAIVLQRLDADGVPQWGPDGVSLERPSGVFLIADLHADGAGNVIVSGSAQLSNFDRRLWAQKLGGDGAPLWGADPVEVFDGSDGALQFGYFPPFVTDGDGGAVFAWYQVGGGTDTRVRIQRVLSDGSFAFAQNGVDAATGTDLQRSAPSAAFDPATEDVYVLWPEEQQVGTERFYGVSAQRIDAAGARQWGDTGRVLVPLGDEQGSQVSALALDDGALLTWSLGAAPNPMRIESTRLDADGAFVWPGEIVPLKTAATQHSRTQGALSSDGFGAYVWADGDEPAVIKAQNVGFDGVLGPVEVETLEYAHDDGTGNVNIGPPSTFDPDMLWGNYYLTQPGGEIITEISIAFGPTFPSLADGPVTFWLLDDPDMDLDPRNATSLASVEATPDVSGNTFFTVEIPPTQVSGAFFVGASALLQGGEDRPARLDTDGPPETSWFFYAPDIGEVIDDLGSAPFGTPMDSTAVVPFPGAFMVRATGEPGEGTPAATIDPSEVTIPVTADETASATLSLSNIGTAELTYTATVVQPTTALVDFEDGQNPYGFTLGIPQAETIETSGGNPGRWLRNDVLVTFAPRLYVGPEPDSPWLGDYVARGVQSISVDAQTVSASNTVEGRPFSLRLIRHNGEPDNPEAHDYVYFPGALVPQPSQGWQSYEFQIPSDFEGTLPEGWSGGSAADPETLPPGVVWEDILREVDAVEMIWGHPAFFYLLQDFDLGVDNVQITYIDSETESLVVDPPTGTVAPGESTELTLLADATGLEPGSYAFTVQIETNAPAQPMLSVPVTLEVTGGVGTDDAATPTAFVLRQNYPNPFVRTSTIEFGLSEREHVTLTVFDVTGRRVATLVDGPVEAGTHRVTWDAAQLPAGMYVYRIRAGTHTASLRALLVD